jgi:hypothetical protein
MRKGSRQKNPLHSGMCGPDETNCHAESGNTNARAVMESSTLTLPIFPLSSEVLFPRARLSLYVYESRYVSLVRDCLRDDHRMGIALLKNISRRTSRGQRPFHSCLGIGRILDADCSPDGNYKIVLEGLNRCRVVEEIPHEPYRVARLRSLGDCYDTARPENLKEPFRELMRLAEAITEHLPRHQRTLRSIFYSYPHPSILADLLAFHLVPGAYDRQCLLEELDVGRRLRLVLVQLRTMLHRLSNGASV